MSSNKLVSYQKYIITMLFILFISCGSFGPTSFVSSDGIYSNKKSSDNETQSNYYKNYFEEKKLDLNNNLNSDLLNGNDFINSSDITYSNSNPGWGDIPDNQYINIDMFGSGYYNRHLGYNYYNGYGFYNVFDRWNGPHIYGPHYYSYHWNTYHNPYHFWNPYYNPYRFYRYHWYNKYSYYDSYYYNNRTNPNISYSVGSRSSSSNVVKYIDRGVSSNNANKFNARISYNSGRSILDNPSKQNSRNSKDFDIIILRKDGSSEKVRNYQTKFGRDIKVDEESQRPRLSSKNTYSGSGKSNSSNWSLSGRNYRASNASSNSTRPYYDTSGNRSEMYNSSRSYYNNSVSNPENLKPRSNVNSANVRSYPNPSESRSLNNDLNLKKYNSSNSRSYSSSSSNSSSRSYSSSSSPSTSRASSSSSSRGSR
jgi:hypothetical protein